MYIIKNALRCISRSKGRNILIGIIVLVISISACIGLSIRQAAEDARQSTLDSLEITASISFDRQQAMSGMQPPSEDGGQGGFDRGEFADKMNNTSSLSLEEYQTYAEAESVKAFYYSMTASLNGSDDFLPVSNDEPEENESDSANADIPQNAGGMPGMNMGGGFEFKRGAQSDFSVVGFSGEEAMTDFIAGSAKIEDGSMFTEGTADYECIISTELSVYNSISVGDTITLTNPNNEEEVYTLSVVGIYSDSTANEQSFSFMGSTSSDPANKIYMSYAALKAITDASSEVSTTQTDETTGREVDTALSGSLEATYVFADVDDYEAFEEQARELGLSEEYTVYSADIQSFENSLTPLNTLSQTAGYFLIVILIIGAVILIVLNIFSVRERKYEIGVLTAMGMKKGKVAMQFLTEIFVVTLAAVIIGAGIGAVSSVPVANALLENQVSASSEQQMNIEQNFGRGEAPDNMGEMPSGDRGGKGQMGMGEMLGSFMQNTADYVTEINSATNLTVLAQMLLIAVALTLVAGAASMLFIMRYEPLKILSNRD